MTSKEALKDLVAMATLCLNKEAAQRLLIIKKDLEVLEILKKYSYSNDHSILFIALDGMKSNELEKVMEWLEK